jgi:hypothetical protein
MKRHIDILLPALLLIAALLPVAAQDKYAGSFLEIPVGAKALGLGGAFTAIADDGTAFYWNPSGASLVESKLLSGMYSSQYGPIGSPLASFYFVGWTMPVSSLAVSMNWVRFAVSDIPRYDDLPRYPSVQDRYERAKTAVIDETFSDTEDAFIFSVARNNKVDFNLGWSYFSIPIEIPLGVNFKLIRQSLAASLASGFGIDAGGMLRFNLKDFFFSNDWPSVSVGMTMKDIGGTRMTWTQTGRPQEIPQSLAYGVAIQQPLRFIDCMVTLSGDYVNRYEGEESLGLEVEYRRQFNFRLGRNDHALTVGAGVDFNFFHVDYAYLADSERQLGQVHRLGLSFNFDKLLEKKRNEEPKEPK